jgi:hypothetical protein
MAHSPATRGLVRCWPRTTRPHRGLTNQPVNSGPFGIPEHGKQRWRCAGQQGAARFPPRPGSAGWRHVRGRGGVWSLAPEPRPGRRVGIPVRPATPTVPAPALLLLRPGWLAPPWLPLGSFACAAGLALSTLPLFPSPERVLPHPC